MNAATPRIPNMPARGDNRAIVKQQRALMADKTRARLKELGLSQLSLLRWEPAHLYEYLHPDEKIGGAIYGHLEQGGYGLLVATDMRVLYLDRIMLSTTLDEVPYSMVSGVALSLSGIWDVVTTLHTREGTYKINGRNTRSAQMFVDFVETTCIDIKKEQETSETAESPPIARMHQKLFPSPTSV